MTVPVEEATANYVPAAAVIRRWRALSGFTGCKGSVDGDVVRCESPGLNPGTAFETMLLECRRGKWNSCVAVKCVDIRRNTSGEGGLLDCN